MSASAKRFLTPGSTNISNIVRYKAQFSAEQIVSRENLNRTIECMKQSPSIRMDSNKTDIVHAAVLVPLCIKQDGEVSLLYTRRSGKLSRHVRQVSFPGGLKDPGDATDEECALRETEEEIGLSRSRVKIWNVGKMIRPPRTAAITPVYGIIENLSADEIKLNHDEVEEVFTLPIFKLCSPECRHHTQFREGYTAPVYLVDGHKVWGITGAITHNFLACFLRDIYDRKVPYIRSYTKS